MRIWSIHPKYLDGRGLVALWREALLAQAVLKGETKGYVHHPQLVRFRTGSQSVGFIAEYLRNVHKEALNRGYRFAAEKISSLRAPSLLTVTCGQIDFEWQHLMKKLVKRDPKWLSRIQEMEPPKPHPLFRVVSGSIAHWEKGASATRDI